MSHSGTPRQRRARPITAIVVVAVLVVALAGATAGYLLLRTTGSPQQTAASYLQGWQRGNYPAMDKVSVNMPSSGVAGPLRRTAAELGIRRVHLSLGPVSTNGGTAQARFTATDDLASGHT
jgi:hypothetical protein